MNAHNVRVRFAPSPTGHLHIGGMRSAIFNWLFARHYKGVFLLRIEDTDINRSKQEYTDSIIASFSWMGINWDEPIVIQSNRAARHADLAQQLVTENKAYYCSCTQEEIIARIEKNPLFDKNFIKYDGYCRINKPDLSKGPCAIRFQVPDTVKVEFDDLIRGMITIGTDQLDDFIIVRSDGTPMYNFVVVIDDADMKISHVIRGEEHIANTPKQILLYQALGFIIPHFAHLPMILGADGSKLSKRDAATGVFEYRAMGYLPEALFNYLVRLGWAHGDQEVFTQEELIQFFSLAHVGKKGAIFDQQKLDWINGLYMRQTGDDQLLEIILKDVCPSLFTDLQGWDKQTILQLIGIYKQRAKTLLEIVSELIILHNGPSSFDTKDLATWITPTTQQEIAELRNLLSFMDTFDTDTVSAKFKEWTKQKNIKMVTVAQPIRIALIGKSSGPGIFELMAIIGKQATIDRINTLLKQIDTAA